MRRYTLTVNDSTKVVDIEAVGANLFRVQIDGHLVDVTLEDHRDLAHSAITPAIRPHPAPSRSTPPAGATTIPSAPPVRAGGADRPGAEPSALPAPAAAAARPTGGAGGLSKITAPMPGVVLSIEVAPGATVRRGDTVLVLEAMKMKNELKAPRDGLVAELYVAAGQQVKYGETLVRLEEN